MKPREYMGLALRNTMRYKRRTLITAAVLVVGISVFILFDSLIAWSMNQSEENLVDYELGAARIMTAEYWDKRENLPLKEGLPHVPKLLSQLEEAALTAAPRISFSAELIFYEDPFPADGSLPVVITALDPEKDPKVFPLKPFVKKGDYLEQGDEGLLMGSWLASDLGAEPGFPVLLVTRTKDGYYQTVDLTVKGILETSDPALNRAGLFICLDVARDYLEMEEGATEINLKLPKEGKAFDAGVEKARKIGEEDNLVVIPWQVLGKDYITLSSADTYGNFVILFLVALIASIGLANTMLMATYERRFEIGAMRALGMMDKGVIFLFTLEAGIIGAIGALGGIALGAVMNIYAVRRGIDISILMENYSVGYRITGLMKGTWRPEVMAVSLVVSVVLAMVISFFSARRISRKSVSDNLRRN